MAALAASFALLCSSAICCYLTLSYSAAFEAVSASASFLAAASAALASASSLSFWAYSTAAF
jgi:hypothetical protein